MKKTALMLLSGWTLAFAMSAFWVGTANAACPGDKKTPSLFCPGDKKTPSVCPGDKKTPSACPGDKKTPSAHSL
jgi:hypothetical protein